MAVKTETPPPHGVSERSARGRYAKRWGACRCEPCRAANKAYMDKYRSNPVVRDREAAAKRERYALQVASQPKRAPRPKPVELIKRNPDQMATPRKDPIVAMTLEQYKRERAAVQSVRFVELAA